MKLFFSGSSFLRIKLFFLLFSWLIQTFSFQAKRSFELRVRPPGGLRQADHLRQDDAATADETLSGIPSKSRLNLMGDYTNLLF